jgi:hypothetical protein
LIAVVNGDDADELAIVVLAKGEMIGILCGIVVNDPYAAWYQLK